MEKKLEDELRATIIVPGYVKKRIALREQQQKQKASPERRQTSYPTTRKEVKSDDS